MKFNSKVLFTFVIVAMMAISVSACSTSAEATEAPASDAAATEAPATDAAATEAPATTGGDIVAQFTFTNTGSEEICELYLSPTGQDAWGPDQLGGATIKAGEKYILQNIPAAVYDVKAVGCAGSEVTGQLDIHN